MESPPPIPPEQPPWTPAATLPPGPPLPGAPLPWERPDAPFPESLIATIHLLLMRPREAYRRMAVEGSYAKPIGFALILGVFAVVVSAVYNFVFSDLRADLMEALGQAADGWPPPAARLLFATVGSPFIVAASVLLSTAVYHLFLMLFGASAGGLGASFRVVCYSTATGVLALAPLVGDLAGGVWGLVLCIVGFSVVHRAPVGRAAAAVIVPIALCCACGAPFFFLAALRKLGS